MASWLLRSSTDRVFLVRDLAGGIALCSLVRWFAPTVPLSTQFHEWVLANLRGRNLTTSLLLRKSQNCPFLAPVGIKVHCVCLIQVSFKCFESRPYLLCHVTTIENV